MSEKVVNNSKYATYKITRIIFLIVLIPFLALALFSAYIMLNSKQMGGVPSAFGYSAVLIKDNSFATLKTFKKDTYELFQKKNTYTFDTMVAFYSGQADGSYRLKSGITWQRTNPTPTSATALTPKTFENETAETTEIGIGKIYNIGTVTDPDTHIEYTFVTVYDSLEDIANGTDLDHIILIDDILGERADNNAFLTSTLVYCSTTSSFITFILVPIAFLFALLTIQTIMFSSYSKQNVSGDKERILRQETSREDSNKVINKKALKHLQKLEKELGEDVTTPPAPTPKTVPTRPSAPTRPSVPTRPTRPTAPVKTATTKPTPTRLPPTKPTQTRPTPVRPTTARPTSAKPPAVPPRKPPVRPVKK